MSNFILVGCLLLAVVAESEGQTLTAVKGTRIGVIVPDGFTPAERFSGFLSEETGASIMVTQLPSPILETAKGFTKEGFSRQGMKLLSQEAAAFGDIEGNLFSVSQKAQDIVFEKWIGILGDTQTTFIVTAAFPSDLGKAMSANLKRAVTSAKVLTAHSDPADALTFEITPAQDLSVSKTMGNMVMMSHQGKFPVKNLESPVMVIGASATKDLKVPMRRDFALERLKKTATLADISAGPPEEIMIDGLSGYEIIGQALHQASGKKATIYQVMLFEETDYYLMQGIVADQNKENYLPTFKKTAMSFKRKIARKDDATIGTPPVRKN